MNKFKFYFIVLCGCFGLFSCNKSEDPVTYTLPRYYAVQYPVDLETIEQFLKTHYIDGPIVDHPGYPDDQDIKISLIPDNNTTIQSLFDSPLLHSKEVLFGGVTYKVYYIQTREGVGASPTKVDGVLTSYDGYHINYKTMQVIVRGSDGTPVINPVTNLPMEKTVTIPVETRFEYVQTPQGFLNLDETIRGWGEIFPLFKTGAFADSGTSPNPTAYTNFGAGIMFLPSALAYYNSSKTGIPAYSTLMFKFKLYDLKHTDYDGDGILSIYEDINNDGDFTNDDTDGDGVPNYQDADDDGDGYLTREETKKPAGAPFSGNSLYYPFNPISDNLATPEDETELYGVPNCGADTQHPDTNTHNFTDPSRIRKYLDKNCH